MVLLDIEDLISKYWRQQAHMYLLQYNSTTRPLEKTCFELIVIVTVLLQNNNKTEATTTNNKLSSWSWVLVNYRQNYIPNGMRKLALTNYNSCGKQVN